MKRNSGEAIIVAALVGLAIGAIALWINTGNEAQALANASGREVSQMEIIEQNPGKSAATLLLPAAGGALIGWGLQEISGDNSQASRDNDIRINDNRGNVTVTVSGDSRTDSNVRTDTRTER